MEERSRQSVDWWAYFKSIRTECPWSYAAYNQGRIDIVEYRGVKIPLGTFMARMYVLNVPDSTVQSICDAMDYNDNECEWLFSYPGYGEYATPVPVLIQQNRSELDSLRAKLALQDTADS